MGEIRFMLVTTDFVSYIVTTTFTEIEQLQDWLDSIQGNAKFVDDPISHLPPKSFANILITNDDIADMKDSGVEIPSHYVIDQRETWDLCHGTLLVDDNESVFYSLRNNTDSDWKLPFMLTKGNVERFEADYYNDKFRSTDMS